MAHRQEMWKCVRCPALSHSGRRAVLLCSGFSNMILDPNLEKKEKKAPLLNHMLLPKYESPVDFSMSTHMLKVYNILK